MARISWQGYPTCPDKSGWHWLKLKQGFKPIPMYWDAIMQSWRDQSQFLSCSRITITHEYVEPVTWAMVYEPHNNTTIII